MRKILFGAILGAVAMYFLDPERGGDRRQMINGMRKERQDTILEAARTTASAVSETSSDVKEVVGGGLTELKPGSRGAGNGAPLAEKGQSGKRGEA